MDYSPWGHKEMRTTELRTLSLFGYYKDFHCLGNIQKASKATFLNDHFTWKWILAFCSPVESLKCVATYLVCSFGGEKQTNSLHKPCWLDDFCLGMDHQHGPGKERLVHCWFLLQSQHLEFLPFWEVFAKNWSRISSFSLLQRRALVLEDNFKGLDWPSLKVSLFF